METMLRETRLFSPSAEFVADCQSGDAQAYAKLREEAAADPVSFWEKQAQELVDWQTRWTKPLVWDPPHAQWFVDGKLNATVSCLDRHLPERREAVAILAEEESGVVRKLTYGELHAQVCQMANTLERLGLRAGDTAAIYMPLLPEGVIAMLACARLGIAHSVIFAGFSQNAVRDRIQDAGCKVVFTADYGMRKGQRVALLETVQAAVEECPGVRHVLVLQRGEKRQLALRFRDWKGCVSGESTEHTPEAFDAEHRLFLLYTSGTTGKPKGIVHTTGGYLTQIAFTTKYVLDLRPGDIYWCTADIGWITGHSYVVYGPLMTGATIVLYEGALNTPHPGRVWEILQRHRVSIFYTAPTAIRSFMRDGDEYPDRFDLSSLRLLGSVGEPINPEAWMWYHRKIGHERCPIVDTWWQTETGGMLIAGVPGAVPQKPGSASLPLPGIIAEIVDEAGRPCPSDQGGYLVLKHPWPAMLRGIHGDPWRFQKTYFSRFRGMYFTGDGAHRDAQGYFWIQGRVDDVLNVSGHRLGTMEVESALVSHPLVAEAAVVGRPDAIKGEAIVAFVTPRGGASFDKEELVKDLKAHVAKEIGALARPEEVLLTKVLPKTRSGKILRRFLRDLAAGKTATGDTSTLENPGLVELL